MNLIDRIVDGIKSAVFYFCATIEIAVGLAVLMFALALLGGSYRPAPAQSYYNHPNCDEFGMTIPGACCCTNDCCREAEPGEFIHLGGDEYRSTVTGQAVRRTGWSPDGRTIKCACDLGNDGRWFKHPKANVRCLFIPMPAM